MLRFYWKLARRTPVLLRESAKKWDTIAGIATLCLLGIGVKVEWVPWWVVFVPILLLFLYGMLKANYEEFRILERKIGGLEAELANAVQGRDEASKRLQGVEGKIASLELDNMELAIQTAKLKTHFARQLLPTVDLFDEEIRTRPLKKTAFQIALFVSNGSIINGWTFEDCVIYGPAIVAQIGNTHIEEPSWTTGDLEDFLWEFEGKPICRKA